MRINLVCRIRVFVTSVVACLLVATTSASALVTLDVNSTADLVDDNVLVSACLTKVGVCTLRTAVMQANRLGDDVTINVPAGTYILGAPSPADGDESGDLNLTAPASGNPVITISGAGTAATTIDANATDRVLKVDAGRTAVVGNLTMRNGLFHGPGGGIRNDGVLTLTNVVVRENYTTEYCGAGIFNDGQIGIYDSTLTTNIAPNGSGGGVCNENNGAVTAGLTIFKTTIDHNFASSGGGVYNNNAGVVVMIDSTVSGNYSVFDGAGLWNGGTTNVYNSTIALNAADIDDNFIGQGGGIYNQIYSSVNLRNSVVAGNYLDPLPRVPSDCNGALASYGVNKFWTLSGCTITQVGPGNYWTGMESLAELGPLRDNGGLTRTHALVPPSSLIDGSVFNGGASACVDANSSLLTVDQRGRSRIIGSGCDLGAFEYDDHIFRNGFEPAG
jgi:hypothetical protein